MPTFTAIWAIRAPPMPAQMKAPSRSSLRAPVRKVLMTSANSTPSTTMTKHDPSRRYAGSYSPVPVNARMPAPQARGTASRIDRHNGSSSSYSSVCALADDALVDEPLAVLFLLFDDDAVLAITCQILPTNTPIPGAPLRFEHFVQVTRPRAGLRRFLVYRLRIYAMSPR